MARIDHTNRLWLLSMMSMGCVSAVDEPADTDTADTTGTTSVGTDDDTTSSPTTASETVADDTTTDAATTNLTTIGTETGDGSSSGGDSDTGSDSSTSGSAEESTTSVDPLSPFVESCVAVYSIYFECFGYAYSEEEIVAICTKYEGYFEGYAEQCLESQTDYFACLSELSCKEFENLGPDGTACNAEYTAGNAACPELFSYCGSGGASGSPDGCGIEASACLDGNSYAVDCDATTCTCSVDGVPGQTFPSTGVDACADDGFGDSATTECGFPEGIFF